MKQLLVILLSALVFSSCSKNEHLIKVAASPVPHAEMLSAIQPLLKKEGVDLRIIEIDDYHLPNRLLAEGQVDANFFQHAPFLAEEEQACGYDFHILKKVHIEPLGIYSKKIKSLEDLPQGATIAIPNDPTNEGRALRLLAYLGLIQLKGNDSLLITPLDILSNPKKIRFVEIEAPLLAPLLPDVELAIIPANFALQAHLSPIRDALALEPACSPYANLLVIRQEDVSREDLQKLSAALSSSELREFIQERYEGALLFAECKD